MIKPEELRIGNVILINDTIRIVEGVIGDQVWFKKGDHLSQDMISNCNHISLSESWLLRMGFGKVWENNEEIEYAHPEFTTLKDYGKQAVTLYKDGKRTAYVSCGYYENTIDCEFVHQLQNLQYALTGTELTIK
jgi:hypothetical protein